MANKVLLINKFPYSTVGGVETVVRFYAEHYSNLFKLVLIATPSFEGESIKIKRVPGKKIVLLEFPQSFVFMGHIFSFSFLLFLIFYSRGKISFIHHQSPFPLGALGLLFRRRRCNVVTTFHAPVFSHGFIGRVVNFLEKLVMSSSSLIIFTSYRMQRFYKNSLVHSRVVPLTCSPVGNLDYQKDRYLDGEPYFLFIGRLAPYKGIDLIIRAFTESTVKSSMKLKIVGPLDSRLDQSIFEDLDPRIEVITSYVSETEKSNLIRRSKVGLLPSTNSGEAFGIVQLEFMSAGKPVINSWLDTGVPEVSLNGVTGITVTANDCASLTAAFNAFDGMDDSKYAALSAAATLRFASQYCAEISCKKLEDAIGIVDLNRFC